MAQHFLLSENARRLSLTQVVGLADAEILALFKKARWGTEDEQVCPRCGVRHSAYFINTANNGNVNIATLAFQSRQARFSNFINSHYVRF